MIFIMKIMKFKPNYVQTMSKSLKIKASEATCWDGLL